MSEPQTQQQNSPASRASKARARKGAKTPEKSLDLPAESEPSRSEIRGIKTISFAERGTMIATAAYYRAQQRNFEPGHEIEDWLAAESEVDAILLVRSSQSP